MAVVEPITKTAFPSMLHGYTDANSTHWLVGTSVRCMLNMCSWERARAYSYALYLSDDALVRSKDAKTIEDMKQTLIPEEPVRRELNKKRTSLQGPKELFIPSKNWQGARPGYFFGTGDKGTGYYEDFQAEAKEMFHEEYDVFYGSAVLRLVMLKDVKTDHVAHGFDRTLLHRIRKAQGDQKKGLGKDTLRTFTNYLVEQKQWPKGTILEFIRLPHGKVNVRVDGKHVLSLQSEAFSWALIDAYYGDKGHMSSSCKEAVLGRAHEVLRIL